jgi:PAS domain S-box-containing protein
MGFMTMNVITSMEKQVDDLLVRELDMKKIIEKSLIGIIVIDKEHKLIDANTAFCNLIGYIQDELIGKYSWEYLDGYTEARVKAEFPKLDEVTNVTKAGFITKNGDIITVKVMGKGGRVQGEPVIVYFVDTFPKD